MNRRKVFILIIVSAAILVLAGFFSYVNTGNTKKSNQGSDNSIKNGEMIETENVAIVHGSRTVDDPNLEYGKESIKEFGLNGSKKVTYSVLYENNREVSRQVVKEETIEEAQDEIIAKGTKILWHCVDATSYDKNAYNDNECTNSKGETKLVSDSQARALDPDYTPGQSGSWIYNNK